MTDRLIKNGLAVFVFFLVINFVAHYFYFRTFGFHGEDYLSLIPSLAYEPSYALTLVSDLLSSLSRGSLGFEGRPLELFFVRIFTTIASNLGGLHGIYLFAWVLATGASFLTYLIFARKGEPLCGFIAAFFLTLSPAFTMRQYLSIQLGLCPSLIFMLAATLMYTGGRRFSPYILITGSLLTYEAFFFPFIAAPLLLNDRWGREFLKKAAIHIALLLVIMAIIAAIRNAEGEDRILAIAGYAAELPARIAVSVLYGTYTSVFYGFFHAAVETVMNLKLTSAALALFIAFVLALFIRAISIRETFDLSDADQADSNVPVLKTALAGLLFAMFSYVTAFHSGNYLILATPEDTLIGIASRVHFPAIFGSAVFLSALFLLMVRRAENKAIRLMSTLFLSALLTLLAIYSFKQQYDYKATWQYQQCLWTNIYKKAPDIDNNTILVVEVDGLPSVGAYSRFGLPMALSRIYSFPKEWNSPPRLSVKNGNWINTDLRVVDDDLEIHLHRPNAFVPEAPRWVSLPQGSIILFKTLGNNIERFDGTFDFNGKAVTLKPKSSIASQGIAWQEGYLKKYLIRDNCDFSALLGIEPPRKLDSQPAFMRKVGFDGTNHINMPSFDRTDLMRYTIDFWLKPDKNIFNGGMYNKTYPPMPAMIGPMRLDHVSERAMTIMLASLDKDGKGASHTVSDILDENNDGRWLHFEINVDNEKREAMFFVNGRLEKEIEDIEIPFKGPFILGKGHLDRFWHGEIADLRISSTIRHTSDFEPEKDTISRDEHTLYLMDGL